MIKYLDDNNFENVIKEGVWLVDFYADWCGPCKMLGKVLESIDANILKVNVDEFHEVASEFSVSAIPTMYLLVNDEVVGHNIGYLPKPSIINFIKKNI